MNWAYSKTIGILVLAQFAIRIPLTYTIDAKPFVSGGFFWSGVAMTLILAVIAPLMDLVAWGLRALRNRRAAQRPLAS